MTPELLRARPPAMIAKTQKQDPKTSPKNKTWNKKLALGLPRQSHKIGEVVLVGKFLRAVAISSVSLLSATHAASAEDTVRVRGTVERIEGPVFVVKTRDGSDVRLTVTDNPLFVAIVPAKISDIKPGMFVGSAGMMQEDGTQKAIEVHIFPEAMRGTGEGHYDWDLLPKSKMTNGNVEQAVTGVDGPVLSVKYKEGEKKLVVTPQTVVVTYEMGKREEIQPGSKIFVGAAKKQPDGTLQTPRITYGRNGEGPAF
jgi:hypothetical protein